MEDTSKTSEEQDAKC